MAKFMKRIVLMLCLLALCAGMVGMAVTAAEKGISATFEVNTALAGDLPDTPDTFTVELTPESKACPMPDGTKDGVYTMTLTGVDSAKFSLSFDRVGVYRYTVKQLPGKNEDCYQDASVYSITAYVTAGKDGSLYLSVVLNRDGNGAKQEKITFGNRYAKLALVTLEATKTMDRKTPKDGAFTFVLRDEKGNQLQTAKNTGKDVKFAPLTYDKEGTYTYTMAEVAGSDSKIVYDKTRYTAVVTVAKDANGDYQGTVVYLKGEKELEGKPAFANKTKSGTPQTGDNANLGLWIFLLILSAAVLIGFRYFDKRKKQQPENQPTETDSATE